MSCEGECRGGRAGKVLEGSGGSESQSKVDKAIRELNKANRNTDTKAIDAVFVELVDLSHDMSLDYATRERINNMISQFDKAYNDYGIRNELISDNSDLVDRYNNLPKDKTAKELLETTKYWTEYKTIDDAKAAALKAQKEFREDFTDETHQIIAISAYNDWAKTILDEAKNASLSNKEYQEQISDCKNRLEYIIKPGNNEGENVSAFVDESRELYTALEELYNRKSKAIIDDLRK